MPKRFKYLGALFKTIKIVCINARQCVTKTTFVNHIGCILSEASKTSFKVKELSFF